MNVVVGFVVAGFAMVSGRWFMFAFSNVWDTWNTCQILENENILQ